MDIQLNNVDHIYQKDTPLEVQAINDITLHVPSGSYTALIGHTGSGKSTLLQHLNVLLKPTSGTLQLGDILVTPETEEGSLKTLREKVGTVFQFPEAQLFDESVEQDVAFGPQNYGATEDEALKIAREILERVGISSEYFNVSPFELSGGQQRRVAIAGVLALEPEVLILDEPTAGLDPKGQKELMALFDELHQSEGMTIILATHQMEQVAEYADQVAVLEEGSLIRTGTPREIYSDVKWLQSKQLDVPETVTFVNQLEDLYGWKFYPLPLTTNELAQALVERK